MGIWTTLKYASCHMLIAYGAPWALYALWFCLANPPAAPHSYLVWATAWNAAASFAVGYVAGRHSTGLPGPRVGLRLGGLSLLGITAVATPRIWSMTGEHGAWFVVLALQTLCLFALGSLPLLALGAHLGMQGRRDPASGVV